MGSEKVRVFRQHQGAAPPGYVSGEVMHSQLKKWLAEYGLKTGVLMVYYPKTQDVGTSLAMTSAAEFPNMLKGLVESFLTLNKNAGLKQSEIDEVAAAIVGAVMLAVSPYDHFKAALNALPEPPTGKTKH